MVCKNCGEQLRSNEKFCTVCGYYNDPDDNSLEADELGKSGKKKKNKKKEVTSLEEYENKLLDEDQGQVFFSHSDHFLSSYIGEDYKWIVERPFNIYALLFSWMYFLYRKLYLIGITGLALTGLVIKFVPIIIVPYIVLSMVGSGIFFNKVYLALADKKVEKIRSSSEGLDNYDIEDRCRRKGGVNAPIALLIFFLFLVITLLSMINIQYSDEEPKFWNENTTNMANCKSIGKQAYQFLQTRGTEGELEEVVCEVEIKEERMYNIYIKLLDKAQYQYMYLKNDSSGYITLKGNTKIIKDLEVTQEKYGLSESDRDFLETSKELSNKFASLKDDAEHEDKLIKEKKDTEEKKHYVFTKDDILN